MQHFVSSSDSMGFERNPLKSYRELDNPILLLDTIFYRKSLEVTGRELDNPVLLLDTFCLFLLNKQNTRSDIDKTLCQFEPAYQGTQAGDGKAIVVVRLLMDLKLRFNMRRVRTLAFFANYAYIDAIIDDTDEEVVV
jgi:hypothetical protein